jgi:hypothetical protein
MPRKKSTTISFIRTRATSKQSFASQVASGAYHNKNEAYFCFIFWFGPASWFEYHDTVPGSKEMWKCIVGLEYWGLIVCTGKTMNPHTGMPCRVYEATGKMPTQSHEFGPPPRAWLKRQVRILIAKAINLTSGPNFKEKRDEILTTLGILMEMIG